MCWQVFRPWLLTFFCVSVGFVSCSSDLLKAELPKQYPCCLMALYRLSCVYFGCVWSHGLTVLRCLSQRYSRLWCWSLNLPPSSTAHIFISFVHLLFFHECCVDLVWFFFFPRAETCVLLKLPAPPNLTAVSPQTLHSRASAKALFSIQVCAFVVDRLDGFFTVMQVWQQSLTWLTPLPCLPPAILLYHGMSNLDRISPVAAVAAGSCFWGGDGKELHGEVSGGAWLDTYQLNWEVACAESLFKISK